MPEKFIHTRSRLRLAHIFLLLAAVFLTGIIQKSSAIDETPEMTQPVVRYRENFDAVTVPQLPNGWTTAATGAGTAFATVTGNFDSTPNAAFSPNPNALGAAELVSPPLLITSARSVLNFRHRYSLENTWDGGVLEIRIGGGNFEDILIAGGAFLSGGYTTTLNLSGNPLAGRLAWSGGSQGFQLTSVQLPASAFGQTVQFRWRSGANESFGAEGWWIDTVTIENITTAANTGAIAIASSGTANPYPSEIEIAGLSGLVTSVSVSLENFSHSSPDDVDIMLAAPNGRRIVLMSDVGGSAAVNNLTLTLTDQAAQNLPDNAQLASGLFRPANFEEMDVFPAPAPQGALSGTGFNAFYGSNPNGVWSLYVVDDNGENAGTVAGGWNLTVQSSVNACLFSLTPTALAFSSAGGDGSFQINTPMSCGWSVSTASSFINITSPTSGTNSGVVNFSVQPNTGAARTGTISITDGSNVRTFQVQQGSGCPISLSETGLNFSASGGSGNVGVTATAACVWQATASAAWIEITSAQQSGNGTATFNVLSNPSQNARSATVTIGARTLVVNQSGRASASRFDFDADGRSDISVYREGTWYLQQSTAGFAAVQFGLAGDRLAPADYDGDGRTDAAVFRAGTWYILQSSNAQFFVAQFGLASDVPVPADYTGDGRAEIAVYREGVWYTQNLVNNQTTVFQFGLAGDIPVVGDYDADGKADFALFRAGVWYLQRSTDGFAAVSFGTANDRAVTGDFNGDGKADLAVYRAGEWHLLTNFQNYSVIPFGLASDVPVPADYDGDGRTDAAVFRAGTWYILQSSNAQFFVAQFGLAGDRAVPNAFRE